MTDYSALNKELSALISGVPHPIANMANAASLLYNSLEDLNWAGFYLMENGILVLGPFMGKPACIEIPVGKGVCGTAWERRETIVVPDVHKFPGHIACSSLSQSEIVVPIFHNNEIHAVLDIDSKELATFDEVDKEWLEKIVTLL
jgi:GAF domain-containing protein